MNRISKFNLGSVTVRVSRLEILYLLPRSHKSTDGRIYEKAWIFLVFPIRKRRAIVAVMCARVSGLQARASLLEAIPKKEPNEEEKEPCVERVEKKLLLALSHWSLTQTRESFLVWVGWEYLIGSNEQQVRASSPWVTPIPTRASRRTAAIFSLLAWLFSLLRSFSPTGKRRHDLALGRLAYSRTSFAWRDRY